MAEHKMACTHAIVWFRYMDLRLTDNAILQRAIEAGKHLLPIFVLDPKWARSKTKFNFPKVGARRAKVRFVKLMLYG